MACPRGKMSVKPKKKPPLGGPKINHEAREKIMMTCPYDQSHKILPFRFDRHEDDCRRRHLKAQEARNEEPLFNICRYNGTHHIRKEELESHEANCEDRNPDAEVCTAAMSTDPVGSEKKSCKLHEASLQAIQEIYEQELEATLMVPAIDPLKRVHEIKTKGLEVIKMLEAAVEARKQTGEFYKGEEEADDIESLRVCFSSASSVYSGYNSEEEFPESLSPIHEVD